MGELKRIDDQHFLAFGVRVFGINFNSLACRQAVRTAKVLQLRLQAPLLASVSDVLENNQRSRKGSLYSISFLCLTRYDRQPTCEPSYTKIYQTLLSFLGQQKYRGALREIRRTEQFDQKL